MPSKAARTKAFIIETIAPVFNKHGYVGTSMSDLTTITGLTKGALYGNFENKEALALAAYSHNSGKLIDAIDAQLEGEESPLERILKLTNFYRNYDNFTFVIGGCPIVNVGVDANHNNAPLQEAVKQTIKHIEHQISIVIEEGVQNKQMHIPVPSIQFAKQLFTMIQGAVTMATITEDRKYLRNTIAYLEVLVKTEVAL